jgi:hypothetical protein
MEIIDSVNAYRTWVRTIRSAQIEYINGNITKDEHEARVIVADARYNKIVKGQYVSS